MTHAGKMLQNFPNRHNSLPSIITARRAHALRSGAPCRLNQGRI